MPQPSRFSSRIGWSTAAAAALIGSACASVDPPARPLSAAGEWSDTAVAPGTEVSVSRDEVRVAFAPHATQARWGWTEAEAAAFATFSWTISVMGVEGPRSFGLSVRSLDGAGRDFPSLAALVESGSTTICVPGMLANCGGPLGSAHVEGGRVIVTLRDRDAIASLFGMRPEWVYVHHQQPGPAHSFRRDSIRVRYVDPQLPVPDSAARAESAAARRAYRASIRSTTRFIAGPEAGWGLLWLVVGDSAGLRIGEYRCVEDLCGSGFAAADSGWSVSDPSIARIVPVPHEPGGAADVRRSRGGTAATLVALRPGRTRVRVWGIHGPSDTIPSRTPPAREVETEVLVSHPIASVEVVVADSVVGVEEALGVRVRVVDVRGGVLADAPVELEIEGGYVPQTWRVAGSGELRFYEPGVRVIRASFGGREAAEEVRVRVVGTGP